MGSLIFNADADNYFSRQTEFRGPDGREYYEGDYQIMPGADVSVCIEKGLAGTFPVYNLRTRSELRFRRSWSHIRRDKTDVTIVWFVKRGRIAVSNHAGRSVIESGECTVTRSLEPFFMENLVDEESCNEVLHIVAPTHLLRSYIPDSVRCGSPFSFGRGDCRAAERTVATLFEEGGRVDGDVAENLMRAALGALGHCMADKTHINVPRTLSERRLGDILNCLKRQLSNPDLSLAVVAKSCGISSRYLCHVLNEHDTSFSELLWSSRLECTKQWLSSAGMRSLSIAEIAYKAGFKSPAHFSRMFKRATSRTPRDFREAARLPRLVQDERALS
jgi:AraC-like DNA-binding protein